HRAQPSELAEELPVLVGRELGILPAGRVAVDASRVAAVQERVLDEERPHAASEPCGEDLGPDAKLLRGLHRVASRAVPRRAVMTFGKVAVCRQNGWARRARSSVGTISTPRASTLASFRTPRDPQQLTAA